MSQSRLVPCNKDDQYALDLLKQADALQLLAVAGELLAWLADINWPVTGPLAELLCPYVNHLKPELLPILKGRDFDWKYCYVKLLIEPRPSPALARV